ncbi:PAS domain-containing protein [Rhodovibrionaceae bacterium A322]
MIYKFRGTQKPDRQCGSLSEFEQELTGEAPKALFDVWRDHWHGTDLPLKEDMAPEKFKFILPDVFLYQYDAEKQDFFIRLVGDNILTVRQGRYKIGQYLDELMGKESGDRGREIWSQVVKTPAVAISLLEDKRGRLSERIILPLRDQAGNLCIMGATSFHSGLVLGQDYEPLIARTNHALFLDLKLLPPRS